MNAIPDMNKDIVAIVICSINVFHCCNSVLPGAYNDLQQQATVQYQVRTQYKWWRVYLVECIVRVARGNNQYCAYYCNTRTSDGGSSPAY
jgi:hypothetical protein